LWLLVVVRVVEVVVRVITVVVEAVLEGLEREHP
jgi:hypothetical protein